MGTVLKEEQEINPGRHSEKKDPPGKRGSFYLPLMERSMPSS